MNNRGLSFKERLASQLPPPPISKKPIFDPSNPRYKKFFQPAAFQPEEFPFTTVAYR